MKTKLIISDVDKTLVPDCHTSFSNDLIKSIQQFQLNGGVFCLCSGRPTFSLINLATQLNNEYGFIINYVSGYNGAQIYDMKTNSFLYDNELSVEQVSSINDAIVSLDQDYLNYQQMHLVSNNPDSEYATYESIICERPIELISEVKPSPKVLGLITPTCMDDVMQKMKTKFSDLNITKSTPYFLEVTNPGIDKAHTLSFLANHLAIDINDTVSFGDNLNDLEMIKLAGTGVAVDNALDEVKLVANTITLSVNDNGVSKYINEFILV